MEATDLSAPGAEARPAETPAWTARLAAWDLRLLRRLASLELPRAATLPLILLVRIGDGWMWCVIAFLLWRALPFAELKTVVLHCVLAIAVSLAFYWPVKLITRRARPYVIDPTVTAKVPPLDKYSFPSGHTMNNLAVALTLSLYLPQVLPLALALPLVLGGLRVLFGVHYLSDIAGGAVLGVLSFLLAWLFFPVPA